MVVRVTESAKPRGENENLKKKSLLVAQEISFAKVLAGNDKKLRDRGVKRLRKWLITRSRSECDLNKDDFMRLWKGLFYCMWMADKPLFQEELAETISSLVHCFQHPGPAIKFMEGFFETIAVEWKGIDQHRLEKFLMFVRRFLRQCLVFVEQRQWNCDVVKDVTSCFQATYLPDHEMLQKRVQPPLGLVMHFTEIFLEELAKVSKGNLDEEVLLLFLKPFVLHLSSVRDGRISGHIRHHIFMRLLEQSPVGLEFQEKFNAWRKLGFPGGSIDVMERDESDIPDEGSLPDGEEDKEEEEEDDDDDDEMISNAVGCEEVLDPRAGKVDVELPLINFNPGNVAKFLEQFRFKKYTNSKTRKILSDLISKFEKLAEGDYPLGLKVVPEMPNENINDLTEEAAVDLMDFVNEINVDNESEEDNDVENMNDKPIKSKNKKKLKKKLKPQSEENEVERRENHAEDSKVVRKVKLSKKQQKMKLKGKNCKNIASTVLQSSEVTKDPKPSLVDNEETTPMAISSDHAKFNEPPKSILQPQVEKNEIHSKSGVQSRGDVLPRQSLKKLKRRASLPATLESSTAVVTSATNLEANVPAMVKSEQGKKSKKKKSSWDEDLQDGEYEVFIPRVNRKRKLSEANDSLNVSSGSGINLKNPFASPIPGAVPSAGGSSSKRVNFVLHRNTAQATSDYFRTLRENPAIPFDATKEPTRSVLRPSPYNSPVNPFYKRKLKV